MFTDSALRRPFYPPASPLPLTSACDHLQTVIEYLRRRRVMSVTSREMSVANLLFADLWDVQHRHDEPAEPAGIGPE